MGICFGQNLAHSKTEDLILMYVQGKFVLVKTWHIVRVKLKEVLTNTIQSLEGQISKYYSKSSLDKTWHIVRVDVLNSLST